jgi:Nickel responsive protein SCO4226-like
MAPQGMPVDYLSTMLIPAQESVLCLFDAPSVDAVEEVNRRAGFAFERVSPAFVVLAPGRGGGGS